jgi:DNA-binding transcriptional LysR family regulator
LSGHFIGYLPAHYAALWVERGEMRPLLPDRLNYDSVFQVATRKGAPKIGIVEAFLEDLRRETEAQTYETEAGATRVSASNS